MSVGASGAGPACVKTPTMTHDVLILGAGLSGLKAARDLQAAGKNVLVLDKGRGVGGRAATRRWDGVPVDHGAQFFTARSPEFRAQVADWIARGVCFEWAKGFHQWEADRGLMSPDADKEAGHPRHACRAGMSALGKDLAAGLTEGSVRMGARAVALGWVGDHWQVTVEGADEPVAGRRLVSTLPVPQALALFEQSSADAAVGSALAPFVLSKLRAVETAPALAVMLRGDVPAPEWQGVQLRDETITWIGADSDKRTPAAGADGRRVFVLHGSGPFTREWQDRNLEEAADRIVARAGEIVGGWITKLPERQVHRWRYSSVPHGLENDAYLRNGGYGEAGGRPPVYFAGDTFLGSKIEGAYCSGRAVAAAILAEG